MKRRIENRRFSETGLRELCVSLAAPIPVPRCDRTAPSGSPNYRTSEWAAGSPAAGLPLLAGLVLYQLGQATALNLLAGLYFSQLLVNAVLAWTLPGRRWRLFALGLTLFVGCDVCVGAFNSPGLAPAGAYQFAQVGMWLFYLPSQVLIALSALPEEEAVP